MKRNREDVLMKKYLFFLLLLMVFLAGCSDLMVFSDYDPQCNFTNYRSYRWSSSAKEKNEGDYLTQYPFVYSRITSAVDRELATKGFTLIASDEADFILNIHAHIDKRTVIRYRPQAYYPRHYSRRGGFWYDPWWSIGERESYLSSYEEETLVVDVVDARLSKLVWRGVAKGLVKQYRNADAMQADIDRTVSEILRDFPPGQGKK